MRACALSGDTIGADVTGATTACSPAQPTDGRSQSAPHTQALALRARTLRGREGKPQPEREGTERGRGRRGAGVLRLPARCSPQP